MEVPHNKEVWKDWSWRMADDELFFCLYKSSQKTPKFHAKIKLEGKISIRADDSEKTYSIVHFAFPM